MRTYVVTGSASGIGRATSEKLRSLGHRVIGVDLQEGDIAADLSTASGRATLAERATELSGGVVDGVIAVAGLGAATPATVAVNYFGAVATIVGLRACLTASAAPRAVVVASLGVLEPVDQPLLGLLESGDEPAALARAAELSGGIEVGPGILYTTSKLAIARWVRRHAATPEWAGAGIALNAVAPGLIETPMSAAVLASPEALAALTDVAPAPYHGPAAPPSAVASLLVWLADEENQFVTGQVVFVDGGAESLRRPGLV